MLSIYILLNKVYSNNFSSFLPLWFPAGGCSIILHSSFSVMTDPQLLLADSSPYISAVLELNSPLSPAFLPLLSQDCPQTCLSSPFLLSPPSPACALCLQALTWETERWIISGICPSQDCFSQQERCRVRAPSIISSRHPLSGARRGVGWPQWIHFSLLSTQGRRLRTCLGKHYPLQRLINKPSCKQAALQRGWKREEERLFSKPCSDPRFDKPTLFFSSPSLASQEDNLSIYECKCFLGQKQVRKCCAGRITHPLFHQGTYCNTEKCCLCPLSSVLTLPSCPLPPPPAPGPWRIWLSEVTKAETINIRLICWEQPWDCISKNGWVI